MLPSAYPVSVSKLKLKSMVVPNVEWAPLSNLRRFCAVDSGKIAAEKTQLARKAGHELDQRLLGSRADRSTDRANITIASHDFRVLGF